MDRKGRARVHNILSIFSCHSSSYDKLLTHIGLALWIWHQASSLTATVVTHCAQLLCTLRKDTCLYGKKTLFVVFSIVRTVLLKTKGLNWQSLQMLNQFLYSLSNWPISHIKCMHFLQHCVIKNISQNSYHCVIKVKKRLKQRGLSLVHIAFSTIM